MDTLFVGSGYINVCGACSPDHPEERLDAITVSEYSPLCSAHGMKGYPLRATDGEIGHVEDVLIDVENGSVRFLVVDTGRWLGRKKVLISPRLPKESTRRKDK